MTAAAFKATYADWKLIKTRGCVQLVFEVPLHEADMAYQVVGGMPDAAAERWFGIARLKSESEVMPDTQSRSHPRTETPPASVADTPVRARKSWQDMSPSQQAGILCADRRFWAFLREQGWGVRDESNAVHAIYEYCGITSRSLILPGTSAGGLWKNLHDKYQAWLMVPA